MSTEAAQTQTSTAGPPHAGPMSLVVPMLLSTLLTLAVVAGGVFWLLRSGKLGSAQAATPVPAAVAAPVAAHVVALEPMIVNLADGRSYLRAAVSLRIQDEASAEKKEEAPKDPKAVDGAATALRDTTLSVLSSATAESLLAPEGRASLKQTLERAYKEHNEGSHVLEVYFTEFLVQRG